MKRSLSVVAIVILCTSLAGCSGEKSETELESAAISSSRNVQQVSSASQSMFPEYFDELVDSYDDSAEKYNLSYKYPIKRLFHEEKNSDVFKYSYNFAIQSTLDSYSCETISVREKTDGKLIKSYKATFSNNYSIDTIRDFLLATIIMANPDIDFEQASTDAQNLINSYDGTDYSDIYKTDTYSIMLSNQVYLNPCTVLYVMYNDEINAPIDMDSYSVGTYEMISSPLNAGKPISINVSIQGKLETDSTGHSTLDVSDELGNIFSVHLSYPDFCIDLNTQKTFTFYGIITKTTGLRLEYFTECNE